jgi:RNA methyltransferase, TrmH family
MPLSRERERLLRRIATRKGREKEGVVLVEGPRGVSTALDAGAGFSFVLVEEGECAGQHLELLRRMEEAGVEVVSVPSHSFRDLVDTETPQGVAGVVREPRPELPDPHPPGPSSCLVLDRVQDPGNAGTLIRAAAAFGVDRVLALDGTVDVWNPKAVRASAGLAFRIPVHRVAWDEVAAWLSASGFDLLVADAGGRDVRGWAVGGHTPERWALLVGNEGAGPRPEAFAAAAASLAVPLAQGVDSINVAMAGTVLLWALGPGASS